MKRIRIMLASTVSVAVILCGICVMLKYMARKFPIALNEAKIASESFEKLSKAISKNDSEAVRKLFAKEIIQSTPEIDKQIDELFAFFDGSVLSYELIGGAPVSIGQVDNHQSTVRLHARINVKTSTKKYHLMIVIVSCDTASPNNVGLHSIYVVETENLEEPVTNWSPGYDGWIPGIILVPQS